MIHALMKVLKYVLPEDRLGLHETIHSSLETVMEKTRAGKPRNYIPHPENEAYEDEVLSCINSLKAPQVKNLQEDVFKYFRGIVNKLEDSKDPVKAVSTDKLFLENTSADVVQVLINYMYTNNTASQVINSRDAGHLCEVYDLAAHLHLFAVANHCMNLIAAQCSELFEPSMAAKVLGFASSEYHRLNCGKIRDFILLCMANCGASALREDDAREFLAVVDSLDRDCAITLAKMLMTRTQQLKLQLMEKEISDSKLEATSLELCPHPLILDNNAVTKWIHSRDFCQRFHLHEVGCYCFAEDNVVVQDVGKNEIRPKSKSFAAENDSGGDTGKTTENSSLLVEDGQRSRADRAVGAGVDSEKTDNEETDYEDIDNGELA